MIHRFTSGLKFAFVTFRKPYYLNKYIGPSSNLPLADCMSFSCKFKLLRSGNLHDLRKQPKMSVHGDENTEEKRKREYLKAEMRKTLDSLQS